MSLMSTVTVRTCEGDSARPLSWTRTSSRMIQKDLDEKEVLGGEQTCSLLIRWFVWILPSSASIRKSSIDAESSMVCDRMRKLRRRASGPLKRLDIDPMTVSTGHSSSTCSLRWTPLDRSTGRTGEEEALLSLRG